MKRFLLIPFLFAVFACNNDGSSGTPNGEACEENLDCESFMVDEENGGCWQELVSINPFFGNSTYMLTDGMCSNECTWFYDGTPEELAQGSCEDDEYCLVYGYSESICFQACSDESPCREDYVCTLLSDGLLSTCLPPEDAARVINDDLILTANPSTVE